jgi:DNA gyrase subunit A
LENSVKKPLFRLMIIEDELLLFSNKHIVYKMRVHELEDHKASVLGEYLINKLELEEDETIIYIVATEDYKGYMLFFFENGKSAKIDLSSYMTKTNRKKLLNAYSDASRLVHIMYIENDLELVAFSSIDKVLIFNTSNISPRTTRDSQGIQVLRQKKDSIMTEIKTIEEAGLKNPDYYRVKNIPAMGYYLRKEDKISDQIEIKLE